MYKGYLRIYISRHVWLPFSWRVNYRDPMGTGRVFEWGPLAIYWR